MSNRQSKKPLSAGEEDPCISLCCDGSLHFGLPFCSVAWSAMAQIDLYTRTQFMQHYTIPLHDWYLGAQAKIHNFGRDSKIDLLVIFNSRYYKLVGQVLFQQLCPLVGKDLNWSSRNIQRSRASLTQHKVRFLCTAGSGSRTPLVNGWTVTRLQLCHSHGESRDGHKQNEHDNRFERRALKSESCQV